MRTVTVAISLALALLLAPVAAAAQNGRLTPVAPMPSSSGTGASHRPPATRTRAAARTKIPTAPPVAPVAVRTKVRGAQANASSAGTLPRTGLSVLLLLTVAGALTLAGCALRRHGPRGSVVLWPVDASQDLEAPA